MNKKIENWLENQITCCNTIAEAEKLAADMIELVGWVRDEYVEKHCSNTEELKSECDCWECCEGRYYAAQEERYDACKVDGY